MPVDLIPFPITPPSGVVKTDSARIVEGRWSDSDKIRAVRGLPQKVGGWINVSTANFALPGVPRALHAWRDLLFNNFLAAGTYRDVWAFTFNQGNIIYQVTPIRLSGALGNNPITTFAGSTIMEVHSVAHGITTVDTGVTLSGLTTVNSVIASGTWYVLNVVDADNFLIDSAQIASGSGVGGGAGGHFVYNIDAGVEVGQFGFGYGAGPFGIGTWDTARVQAVYNVEPRFWSLDHFGKFLVATYNVGTLYILDPDTLPTPLVLMSIDPALPVDARALFVTPEEFIFALRSNMQVSWCSQGDYTQWTVTTANTANTRTLSEGTKLVAGCVLGPFVSLVLTDAGVYRFQYDGSVFIYSSALVGRDCGLISPGALVSTGGRAFWMGPNNFWMYDGAAVQQIPNAEDIRRFVFSALPQNASYQCAAIYNPVFNEIDFYYPTVDTVNGGKAPDHYVKLMLEDFSWWPGTGTRSGGTHFTQGDTRPYMGDVSGFVFQHENTENAAGAPLQWSLTLGKYALQEGLYYTEVDSIIMDFFAQSGNIEIEFTAYDRLQDKNPNDSENVAYSPSSLTQAFDPTVLSMQSGINFNISTPAIPAHTRLVLQPAEFAGNVQTGTGISVTFQVAARTIAGGTLVAAWIGHIGTTEPWYDGAQQQLTFNGQPSVTLVGGAIQTIVSDTIAFDFDGSQALVIGFSVSSPGSQVVDFVKATIPAGVGSQAWFLTGAGAVNDTTVLTDPSHATADAVNYYAITQIDVQVSAGMIDLRVVGRYIGISMTSSDIDNYMRFGKPVAFIRQGGYRP